MGLFANPLGHAGYPPGVTGTPTTQPASIRAATAAEASAGTLTNCYISPATADSATALDFASPPVLGFGSTTPRPVHATTLDSTGNTSLGTGASSVVNVGVGTSTIGFFGATAVAKQGSTTDLRAALINLGFYTTGGASPLDLNGGALASGTHTFTDATNIVVGSTTGTKIGTATTQKLGFFNATPIVQPAAATDIKAALVNLGLLATGASPLDLGSAALSSGTFTVADGSDVVVGSTTGTKFGTATTQKMGWYNATPVVQQTQGAITNSVTSGGSTGVIADFADLTTYSNSAATIRNDIYQLALGLQGCIAALRTYGLLG